MATALLASFAWACGRVDYVPLDGAAGETGAIDASDDTSAFDAPSIDGGVEAGLPPETWAILLSGAGNQLASNLAVAPTGNVYMGGHTEAPPELGSLTTPHVGLADALVAAIDPGGSPLWIRPLGSDGVDAVRALAADARGVFATGYVSGAVDIDGTTIPHNGGGDVFVAALDPGGTLRWARSIGGGGWDAGRGLSIASDGTLLLAGRFAGRVDFDGDVRTTAGMTDAFVVRMDDTGAILELVTFGGAGEDAAVSVVEAPDGGLYVAGFYGSSMTIGTSVLRDHASGAGMFITKLDSSNGVVFARDLAAVGIDDDVSLAVVADGSVVLGGGFTGTTTLEATSYSALGPSDGILVSWDPFGNVRWVKTIGTDQSDEVRGLALTASGDVVVVARVQRAIQFGTCPMEVRGVDVMLSIVRPSGAIAGCALYGGPGGEVAWSLALSGDAHAFVSGRGATTIDLVAGTTLTVEGAGDGFIARLPLP